LTQRLPTVGSDDGTWGTVLNGFLGVAHDSGGNLLGAAVSAAGAEMTTNKGAASGYAPLNTSTQVPITYLPTGAAGTSGAILLANDSTTTNARTPTGTAGSDLSGSYPNPTVARVNGVAVTGTPSNGQILTASGSTAASWQAPAAISQYAANLGSLVVLGHSWTTGTGIVGPDNGTRGFTSIFAAMIGASDIDVAHYGKSGSQLTVPTGPSGASYDSALQMLVPDTAVSEYAVSPGSSFTNLPNSQAPHAAGQATTLICWGLNDVLASYTTWLTNGITSWTHSMRSVISRSQASLLYYLNDSTITSSGFTQVANTTATNPNGSTGSAGVLQATASGSTLTITIPSDFPGGTIAVSFRGTADTDTGTASVNWTTSGSNASISGSTTLSAQGYAGYQVPVTKRFVCTVADAGKTIVATTTISSSQVNFDSWWIESTYPQPVLVMNTPRANYGSFWAINTPTSYTPAMNTATNGVVAEFGSNVAIVDVDTIWFNRSATLAANMTSSQTTVQITTSGPNWPWQGGNAIMIGAEQLFVNAKPTYTSGGATVTGPVPTGTNLTLSVTRGYNGSTAASGTSGAWVTDETYLCLDAVHPNQYGNAVIANAIFAQLLTTLAAMGGTTAVSQGSKRSLDYRAIVSLPMPDSSYVFPKAISYGTKALPLNTLYAIPWYVPQPLIVTGMGCEITSGGTTNTMRLGIFLPDGTGARPNWLLVDFGTFSTTTAGSTTTQGLTNLWRVMRPGWYFLAAVSQGGSTATYRTITGLAGNQMLSGLSTFPSNTNQTQQIGYTVTGVSGALNLANWANYSDNVGSAPLAPNLWVQVRTHTFF